MANRSGTQLHLPFLVGSTDNPTQPSPQSAENFKRIQRWANTLGGGESCPCFLYGGIAGDFTVAASDTVVVSLTTRLEHNWSGGASGGAPDFPGWAHITFTVLMNAIAGDTNAGGYFVIPGHVTATNRVFSNDILDTKSITTGVSGDLYLGTPYSPVNFTLYAGVADVYISAIYVDIHSICCDMGDPHYAGDG